MKCMFGLRFRLHPLLCRRHFHYTRTMSVQDMTIELNATEEALCTLLDKCTVRLREAGVETTCRIAGGWVRDKLLGHQSDDIDVAVSDMMGLTFAEHLKTMAESFDVSFGNIGKISQNPGQSKHLETATVRIMDRDIDLVNLRSEEYAADSRIPTEVTFGTPLQDAMRRDMTINALFYNVHTRSVEDFTGKGLDDLRDGLIRTPLPPRETFLDDPLRVLRCLRFACRFGFEIVPEIKEAIKDKEIQAALVSKVTRERAGIEITKMLKASDPMRPILMINKLSLYKSIFEAIPEMISKKFSQPIGSSINSVIAAKVLDHVLYGDILKLHQSVLLGYSQADPDVKSRLFLAATLSPYIGITYEDAKRKLPAVHFALWESLKLGTQNHFLDGIPVLFSAYQLFRHPDLTEKRFQEPTERVALGLFLRNKDVNNTHTGTPWSICLMFSLVQELMPYYDLETDSFNMEPVTEIINLYKAFVDRIYALNLVDVADEKPILNGSQLSLLVNIKPGRTMGIAMEKVMEWQLEHPGGTETQCIEFLKEEVAAGRLVVDNSPPTKGKKRKSAS